MKTILYVCVHNAGRSQMAEALTNKLAKERGISDIRALSAGTIAGSEINQAAIAAMNEIGVSMDGHFPKHLTSEMVADSDLVITMGCGVDSDACPARFYVSEDWGLDDPKDAPLETVRAIRSEIEKRVNALLTRIENEAK
jgi:arsenate reductase